MNKFSIGDLVVKKDGSHFKCSGKTIGKVIGFNAESEDPRSPRWLQIEGEYFESFGVRRVNYYNPRFLEKFVLIRKTKIKSHKFTKN